MKNDIIRDNFILKQSGFDMRLLLISISMLIAPLAANAADFEKAYHIKWKEQDGKIIYSTVCYNYKKGSRVDVFLYFNKLCRNANI